MSDRVLVEKLRLDTVIGVYGWERTVRQTLLLDLEMAWDISAAAATDDVEKALDYAKVSRRLRGYASESSVELIETLAENLAAVLREEFAVPWLRLRLSKPGAVAEAGNVAVEIVRGDAPR